MAEKFMRSTRGVRDIDTLSTNLIEVTDVVSTEDGKLYMKGETDFIEIGGSGEVPTDPRVDKLVTDVEKIQSDLSALTTKVTKNETDIKDIQTQNADFETRIKALETPPADEEQPAE